MGIMPFDAQPMPEVEAFIEKHYDGGTVLDFGCGAGRYAHCFPDNKYIGLDGHEDNIAIAKVAHPNKMFGVLNLEGFIKLTGDKPDWLFSSVVFDQLKSVPKNCANKYLLIEPTKYEEEYKVLIKEPLQNISMMVAEDL